MNAFVIIDNKSGSVVGIFSEEKYAKEMLRILGDEKISDEFARFAYENWSWTEVTKWIEDPCNMGLGVASLMNHEASYPKGKN